MHAMITRLSHHLVHVANKILWNLIQSKKIGNVEDLCSPLSHFNAKNYARNLGRFVYMFKQMKFFYSNNFLLILVSITCNILFVAIMN